MAKELFYEICDAIKGGKPEVIEYTQLPSQCSREILDGLFYRRNRLEEHRFRIHFSPLDQYLRIVIPSYLHEAAHSWLVDQYSEWRVNGLIAAEAATNMTMPGSPRVTNFIGSYSGGIKEPDFAFVPLGPDGMRREFPSVVLETGWASNGASLERDRRQWHEGSGGKVMVVILVKLSEPNAQNQVRVTLQVSHTTPATGTGSKIKVFKRKIFPISGQAESNPTVSIEELFGGQCPPDHPNALLPFELGRLRKVVRAYLITDGYSLA